MKILVIGNCQSGRIGMAMKTMMGNLASVDTFNPFITATNGNNQDYSSYDYIFYHSICQNIIDVHKEQIKGKVILYPRLVFRGFHPDMAYVRVNNKVIRTHTGDYSSALILFAYLQNLSIKQTLTLFNAKTFDLLGYNNVWLESCEQLITEGRATNFDFTGLPHKWLKYGCFMNSINHPKIRMVSDIAKHLLDQENIKYKITSALEFIPDVDRAGAIWGCYPEIAEQLGIEGYYGFSFKHNVLDLHDFIEHSYQVYSQYDKNKLVIDRDLSIYAQLDNNKKKPIAKTIKERLKNPYTILPKHHYWNKSVANIPIQEVDPIIDTPFTLNSQQKIATAGSCFAQHLSRALEKNGFNYYVAEPAKEGMSKEKAHKYNYGIFSARFGNIYTARQLNQLFDRAFSMFTPIDSTWERIDGRFVDPFRPQVAPDGYTCKKDVVDSRIRHLKKVKEMFTQLNTFIFTLGLTEAWQSTIDGAIFPLAPGVVAGEMNDAYHFVDFTVNDVIKDLNSFIGKLHKINATANIILTVSPVPLIATYKNQHVLTSTTYSKSVLRVAAEEICNQHKHIAYFPSYEIITGSYTKGRYFEDNLRGIKNSGINHVMRLFFKHYASELDKSISIDDAFNVICDEEEIES